MTLLVGLKAPLVPPLGGYSCLSFEAGLIVAADTRYTYEDDRIPSYDMGRKVGGLAPNAVAGLAGDVEVARAALETTENHVNQGNVRRPERIARSLASNLRIAEARIFELRDVGPVIVMLGTRNESNGHFDLWLLDSRIQSYQPIRALEQIAAAGSGKAEFLDAAGEGLTELGSSWEQRRRTRLGIPNPDLPPQFDAINIRALRQEEFDVSLDHLALSSVAMLDSVVHTTSNPTVGGSVQIMILGSGPPHDLRVITGPDGDEWRSATPDGPLRFSPDLEGHSPRN